MQINFKYGNETGTTHYTSLSSIHLKTVLYDNGLIAEECKK